MNSLVLQATAREKKSGVYFNEGFVRGAIYGKKMGASPVTFNAKMVDEIIAKNGEKAEVTVEFGGVTMTGVIKEIQRSVLGQAVSHIDIHILG